MSNHNNELRYRLDALHWAVADALMNGAKIRDVRECVNDALLKHPDTLTLWEKLPEVLKDCFATSDTTSCGLRLKNRKTLESAILMLELGRSNNWRNDKGAMFISANAHTASPVPRIIYALNVSLGRLAYQRALGGRSGG